MDRDTFIMTVYWVVVEHYQLVKDKYLLRRGGFPPALTDPEVITMEIGHQKLNDARPVSLVNAPSSPELNRPDQVIARKLQESYHRVRCRMVRAAAVNQPGFEKNGTA